MRAVIDSVSIKHISSVVPRHHVLNEDLDFDPSLKKKIMRMIGVKKRHVLRKGESLAPLYLVAADLSLDALGWERQGIDLVITVSQTHEYPLPATSCVLHGLMGLKKDAIAYDITMGCSGYVIGIFNAMSAMSASRGGIRRALLFVGDAISTICHPGNRSTVFLFGDAATCTALEYDTSAGSSWFVTMTDGAGRDHIMVEHGGLRRPIDRASDEEYADGDGNLNKRRCLSIKGADIFDFALREVPPMIDEVLEFSGRPKDGINAYLFHQANKMLVDHLASKIGISDRCPVNMDEYGNASCASIPLLVSSMPEKCLGEKVVMAGFGVGLSAAAAVVSLADTTSSLGEWP